jgi:hypothetical protein
VPGRNGSGLPRLAVRERAASRMCPLVPGPAAKTGEDQGFGEHPVHPGTPSPPRSPDPPRKSHHTRPATTIRRHHRGRRDTTAASAPPGYVARAAPTMHTPVRVRLAEGAAMSEESTKLQRQQVL